MAGRTVQGYIRQDGPVRRMATTSRFLHHSSVLRHHHKLCQHLLQACLRAHHRPRQDMGALRASFRRVSIHHSNLDFLSKEVLHRAWEHLRLHSVLLLALGHLLGCRRASSNKGTGGVDERRNARQER